MAERTDAREKLLDAVLDRLTGGGLGDLSLRALAAAVGTSHRMLIYHFGSKEGLLIEVVRAMETRQRAALADLATELATDPATTPADAVRRFWQRLADPALWPAERLFFELYGQALQGRPGTTPFLDGIVDSWVAPMAALVVRFGGAPESAAADARLGVAVTRGLLLDLLATGDRGAVDAAMERFLVGYFQWTGAPGQSTH
ncbi:MAG TPA: TetR/AcrR family transcriptional regulator [Pseudonocardiaceae bacterium]|jgi:AcrR family transcriptional regulator|nr:TetR/AcrR family transcriptional regulator [Pseudonocardiaceae bacterium]